jgi:hypothetical protein
MTDTDTTPEPVEPEPAPDTPEPEAAPSGDDKSWQETRFEQSYPNASTPADDQDDDGVEAQPQS